MNKVVIVVANSRWFGAPVFKDPTLALPILASILKGHFDYEIIDCNGEDYSEEQCEQNIRKSEASMVLITALTVNYHKNHEKVAELAKIAIPNVPVVMGGVYATTCYEHIMQNKNVDYVMMGHAEERLCQFLDAILEKKDLSNIPGIGFRKNGEIIINPVVNYIGDVEKMVSPDYSKVNLLPYIENGFRVSKQSVREAMIITSYGCPHNCIFCTTRVINGRKVAWREVEDVIAEMRYLKEQYNIDAVQFVDNNILADKNRAKLLFRRMIEEKFNFKVRFMDTALWHLDEEILDLLVEIGCHVLTVSIESGCDRTLHEIIRKPFKKEIVPGIIKMCQERGIYVIANLIIGFPGETWNEIRESIAFTEKCNMDYLRIHIATLLPKSDLYKLAKEQGCISEDFDFFTDETYIAESKGQITTDEFTPSELEILRSYEWDRINFGTKEKREKYCEFWGMTEENLNKYRKSTRKSLGLNAGLRKD